MTLKRPSQIAPGVLFLFGFSSDVNPAGRQSWSVFKTLIRRKLPGDLMTTRTCVTEAAAEMDMSAISRIADAIPKRLMRFQEAEVSRKGDDEDGANAKLQRRRGQRQSRIERIIFDSSFADRRVSRFSSLLRVARDAYAYDTRSTRSLLS